MTRRRGSRAPTRIAPQRGRDGVEIDAVTSTARLLGMPAAVHTGVADACKQAIRHGVRRTR